MELTIIFTLAGFLFLAILAARQHQARIGGKDGAHRISVVLAAAITINFAGAFGIAWLCVSDLEYDEPASGDLSLYALLIAVLVAVTVTGLVLNKRGRSVAAVVVVALGAIPTVLTYGLILLWVSHPVLMH